MNKSDRIQLSESVVKYTDHRQTLDRGGKDKWHEVVGMLGKFLHIRRFSRRLLKQKSWMCSFIRKCT